MKNVRFAAVAALFCTAFLLAISSARANMVPTRSQSSYGDGASTILSPAGTSFTDNGVTLAAESFCSFSNSSLPDCALSFAYQVTSLPAGTTSLTITLPVPAGAILTSGEVSPPFSSPFGILTNDSPFAGTNVFFSPVSDAQVQAVASDITIGLDGAGNPTITITDPSLFNNLAIYMDLADNSTNNIDLDPSGPFEDYGFCEDKTNTTCTFDVPGLTTPEIVPGIGSTATPEPSSLFGLLSGFGLLGVFRRRFRR